MSTTAQILANQKNAQLSTGPKTPEGLSTAAKNSTRHGLTGQTLILAPGEKEAYEAHVASYKIHHQPNTHQHLQLVQQLADLDWSIHQIFIHQSNTMTLMTAVTTQLVQAGDAVAAAAALAPLTRTLNTLSTYETRRRRARKSIQEELAELEAHLAEARQAARKSNEPKPKVEIGSVCSRDTFEDLMESIEAENQQRETGEIPSQRIK
jgi:hypothetical protein